MVPDPSPSPTTRRVLLAGLGAGFAAVSGCSALRRAPQSGASGPTSPPTEGRPSPTRGRAPPLRIGTDPVLYDVLTAAAGLWNANPSPESDRWTPDAFGIETDRRLADYFARRVGCGPEAGASDAGSTPSREESDSGSAPPFRVQVELADDRRQRRGLRDGTVDVVGYGDVDPDERPDAGAEALPVDHVVARSGAAFVVSTEVAATTGTAFTAEDLAGIFAGEVTNWRAVGGPDREIFAAAGPDPQGSNTPFEEFLYAHGVTAAGLDSRAAGPTDRVQVVTDRDDAVGTVRAGTAASVARNDPVTDRGVVVAGDRVEPVDVVVDGHRHGLFDAGYPTLSDTHLFTAGEADDRERAFLALLRSPLGQRRLIGRDRRLVGV